MKKTIALILVTLMVLALSACGRQSSKSNSSSEATSRTTDAVTTEAEGGSEVIDGGFSPAESPTVTDQVKALVEKASANLTGASFVPVAYVESQVVAGKNHVVLCKAVPSVPNAAATYALVTIYEDPDGNAEITNILDSKATAPAEPDPDNPTVGGFVQPESVEVSDEAKTALTKACETLTGAEYKPVALLASQIVAGTNYTMLCRATPTVPDSGDYFVIVTVYADLNGNAEITETCEFGTADDGEGEVEAQSSTA